MILSLIIFGSIGWVLVLIFLFQAITKEKVEENFIVIHPSAFLDGRIAGLLQAGFIEGTLVVAREDMDEILRRINSTPGFSERENPFIAGDFQDFLELKGIKCINIKSLDALGRGRVYVGQGVRVRDVEYGYNKARGHLDDGSIVEIKGELPRKKALTLNCVIESVLEGSSGRKIWARWEND
jgi:uncharacterized protein YacL